MSGHNKLKTKIYYYNTGLGDCSIISVENGTDTINILFDMGHKDNKIIKSIENSELKINGIVVTHIDQDHIKGIIKLLEKFKNKRKEDNILTDLKFIVFNKYNASFISYKQGNKLNDLINNYYNDVFLINSYSDDYSKVNNQLDLGLNISFFSFEKRKLFADLQTNDQSILITFLAPKRDKLKKLMEEWRKDDNGGNGKTGEITNKSSIVCLLEIRGKEDEKVFESTILMTGDQYVDEFKDDLEELKKKDYITKIDCLKLAHHGSKDANKGIVEMIKAFECTQVFNMDYSKVDCSFEKPTNVDYYNIKFENSNVEKIFIEVNNHE